MKTKIIFRIIVISFFMSTSLSMAIANALNSSSALSLVQKESDDATSPPKFIIKYYDIKNIKRYKTINKAIQNRLDNNKCEYKFINTAEFGRDAQNSFDIDFPFSNNGIEVFSPNGNIIMRIENLSTIEQINRVFRKIEICDSLLKDFKVNMVKLNSFEPQFYKDDQSGFFEAGVFGNYIYPEQFVEKGKYSVIIHSIPHCPPCVKLKRELINDNEKPVNVDYIILNHAIDVDGVQYSQREMNATPEFNTYVSEGIYSFPTIWIINPNGKIQEFILGDDGKELGISLKDYLMQRLFALDSMLIVGKDYNKLNAVTDIKEDVIVEEEDFVTVENVNNQIDENVEPTENRIDGENITVVNKQKDKERSRTTPEIVRKNDSIVLIYSGVSDVFEQELVIMINKKNKNKPIEKRLDVVLNDDNQFVFVLGKPTKIQNIEVFLYKSNKEIARSYFDY